MTVPPLVFLEFFRWVHRSATYTGWAAEGAVGGYRVQHARKPTLDGVRSRKYSMNSMGGRGAVPDATPSLPVNAG